MTSRDHTLPPPALKTAQRGPTRRALTLGLAAAGLAGQALAQTPPATAPLAPTLPPAPPPALRPDQAAVVVRALERADAQGLDRDALLALAQSDPAAAALRYGTAVHAGRLADDQFLQVWGLRPVAFDPTPGFSQAVRDDRLQPWLDSLPPPYAGYSALRRGLAAYRAIAAEGGWPAIPDGPPLKAGDSGPRVAALRARLAAEDKTVAGQGPFDAALTEAVIRAQRRYGLVPDGVVGAPSLKAFNQPVGQRVLQILANLERWRWLPAQMPPHRVQVNSAAAIVTLFQDNRPTLSMRAVSGRPGDETPMLQSAIHSVVLNPPWNVPTSIATKELWPKARRDPGYLKREDFVVIPTEGGGQRLQQRAGPKSALGRYKFDFANPYGVYLHDTPAQAGFARVSRLASHGCVRLEKPGPLAKALLQGDPAWSGEAVDAAIAKGTTVRARLPEPVPVYILYWTAFAGPDGQMNFRDDPYGWDRTLLQKAGVLKGEAKPA